MAKKTYQAASSYAKQGQKPKKKSATKKRAPAVSSQVIQPTGKVAVKSTVVASPGLTKKEQTKAAAHDYSYVTDDLKRTGVIAVGLIIILIVLVIAFG